MSLSLSQQHNVQATEQRYLLAVNVNQQFLSCWAHGAKVLTPVIAAAGLAQVLAHTEQRPTLAFFDTDVWPLPLTDTMQMPEICETIIKQVSEVSWGAGCPLRGVCGLGEILMRKIFFFPFFWGAQTLN